MKQINYQGYAQGGQFDPIRVSSANVSRIAAEGARVLKGMELYAEQDLKNQRAQLERTAYNQQLEERARARNADLRRQAIEGRRQDSQRDFQIRMNQLQREAKDTQALFAGLSQFSQSAFKIATDMEERIFQEQSDEQYWKDVWEGVQYGVPAEELLQDREAQHKLNQMGEAMEIRADMAEAAGADPIQIDYFRGLNRAQRHGRRRAMIERAGMDAGEYIQSQFLTNDKLQIELQDDNGQTRTLTPAQAATSVDKAAFMPILLRQFMEERGLKGMKPAMLEPFYLKYRAAMESVLAETRKAEIEQHADERLSTAKDALNDSFSVQRTFDLYNTFRRSGGMSHAEARKATFETLFLSTDESGNLRYSETEVDQFLDAAFPDQPNKSIRDRFSHEINVMLRERRNLENKLHSEQEATQSRQHDEYNDELRSYLNDPKTPVTNEMLQPLLEKAIREGNGEGVKMLQTYMSELSVDAKTDQFLEQQWEEEAAIGVLTVESVRRSNASAKLKNEWIEKARRAQDNAIPKEMQSAVDSQIESALMGKIQALGLTTAKHPSYHAALYHAKMQFRKDFQLAMLRPNATADQAKDYALGQFQQSLNDENGQYSIQRIDPKTNTFGPYFSKFTINPTDQIAHPLTQAREMLKADPQALSSQPLLDRGEIERYTQKIRAGRAATPPMSAQYLANAMNGVSVLDIINAQASFYGIPQIELRSYRQAVESVDPAYQRLLTYTPNRTRVEIAGLGSGQVSAAPRVPGKVNSMQEIARTWIAAGGDPSKAALMTAIAMAESSGRQEAHNPVGPDNSYGLWQINMIDNLGAARRAQYGLSSNEQLWDPLTNAKAAVDILNSSGISAWGSYTDGRYRQYLPQAEAMMRNFSANPEQPSQWRQGSTMNLQVIEYLTGDKSHSAYDPAHHTLPGQTYGGNYHEHVAFKTKAQRDAAVAMLRREGIKIGSMNDGDHTPGSLHYEDLAVDLPMPHHIKPDSREERAYSARIRKLLGIR